MNLAITRYANLKGNGFVTCILNGRPVKILVRPCKAIYIYQTTIPLITYVARVEKGGGGGGGWRYNQQRQKWLKIDHDIASRLG